MGSGEVRVALGEGEVVDLWSDPRGSGGQAMPVVRLEMGRQGGRWVVAVLRGRDRLLGGPREPGGRPPWVGMTAESVTEGARRLGRAAPSVEEAAAAFRAAVQGGRVHVGFDGSREGGGFVLAVQAAAEEHGVRVERVTYWSLEDVDFLPGNEGAR